ncbi:MAG: hypothetical protein JXA78_09440 [Anaerolineales bacterium]|nr:hypothetical protein [Anaerolineales bacterium]
MDKRTTGIIATVVTVLVCGCPGLLSVCWGAIAAAASFIPGAEIDIAGSSDPTTALISGLGALCIGVVFVAIPVAVGFFTLRKKPEAAEPVYNEPIPPAI